jgi:NTP pyrophosphatase (non-canonical NTP hydrolase)
MDAKRWFVVKDVINELMSTAHSTAVGHGFWDDEREVGTSIALIHSELSEALEAFRSDMYSPDEHVPCCSNTTIELADVVIRVFDLCEHLGLDLSTGILQKMAYNESRPYKHGKSF